MATTDDLVSAADVQLEGLLEGDAVRQVMQGSRQTMYLAPMDVIRARQALAEIGKGASRVRHASFEDFR